MRFEEYLKYRIDDDIYDNPVIDEILSEHFGIKFTIEELSAVANVAPQVWGNITAKNPEEAQQQALEIYKKAKELALAVKQKFLRTLRRVSQFKYSKVLVDVKPMESFVDKALNRYPKQGKGAADITDVLRSAVLVTTQEEVDQVVKNIKKLFPVAKHKVKTPEGDPNYGYFGSHHFYVKVENILAEIQVMTKKLWSYKSVAHDIYNKYRSAKDADKSVEIMDKKLSKRIFQLANIEKKEKKGKARKKGKPSLKKHKNWKFNRAKLEMY